LAFCPFSPTQLSVADEHISAAPLDAIGDCGQGM
jgi:hypothetical protein